MRLLAIKKKGDAAESGLALSPFLWNPERRVYLYRSNSKVVPVAKLQNWAEIAVAQAKKNLRAIGQALLDGKINKAEFALQSATEIKNMHRALAMLAEGGKSQMGASQWGRLGSELKQELSYLRRFSSAVDNVEIGSLGDKFLNRIESYGNAGRFTYINAVRARETDAGDSEERNVLGGSAHSCSECLDEAALDWQPAGTLSAPGGRLCGPGCNCSIEYRRVSATGEIEESEVA